MFFSSHDKWPSNVDKGLYLGNITASPNKQDRTTEGKDPGGVHSGADCCGGNSAGQEESGREGGRDSEKLLE